MMHVKDTSGVEPVKLASSRDDHIANPKLSSLFAKAGSEFAKGGRRQTAVQTNSTRWLDRRISQFMVDSNLGQSYH